RAVRRYAAARRGRRRVRLVDDRFAGLPRDHVDRLIGWHAVQARAPVPSSAATPLTIATTCAAATASASPVPTALSALPRAAGVGEDAQQRGADRTCSDSKQRSFTAMQPRDVAGASARNDGAIELAQKLLNTSPYGIRST